MLARRIAITLLGGMLLSMGSLAAACPFCVAEMQTLTEELASADAAVIARLLRPAALVETTGPGTPPVDGTPYGMVDPETGEATFSIEVVLKGEDKLVGIDQIEAIYFGQPDFEKAFLIRGIGDEVSLEWAIPLELSPLAVGYIQKLQALPKSGADRLAFFQPYLEHEDRQLAQDAYDEFARAPYQDLIDLRDRIDRDRVLQLINEPRVSPSRRRLFFTMLGVCGTDENLPMLEAMLEADVTILSPAAEAAVAISLATGGPLSSVLTTEVVKSNERRRKLGLDAMIACYLTLRGEEGLDLVDRRFLAKADADQTHIYSTLMALRFLAEENESGASQRKQLASRERLLQSARLLLDNTAFADQVITDLARWEDWTVIDKLAEMFRVAGESGSNVSRYVREPIITYLDIAAEQPGDVGQQATELIAELEPLDPETFRRARSLQAFGYLGSARVEAARDKGLEIETADDSTDAEDTTPLPESFADDMPPDPASFNAGQTTVATDASTASTPENAIPATAGDAAPTEDPPATVTASPRPVPAPAAPLTPPGFVPLLAIPILGFAGCFGLFWFLLRGSA